MALAFLVTDERFRLATDRRRLPAAELDALTSGVQVLDQARALAQQLHQQAQQQAQLLARQARTEAEARTQAQLAQAVNTLLANASRVLRQLEHVLVEVVVAAVGRMVAQSDPGAVLAAAIREVVAQSADTSFATLRVAPADAPAAAEEVRRLTRGQNLPQTIAVRSDAQLAAGECVLVSDLGKLRLRLDLQLKALRDALQSTLRLDDALAAALTQPGTPAVPASNGAEDFEAALRGVLRQAGASRE